MNRLREYFPYVIVLVLVICSIVVWFIENIDNIIKLCATVASLSGAAWTTHIAFHIRESTTTERNTNSNSGTNNDVRAQQSAGVIVQDSPGAHVSIGDNTTFCNDPSKIVPIKKEEQNNRQ